MAVILYFCDALLRMIFEATLGSSSVPIAMLIPYIPVFVICLAEPNKYIKKDFALLMLFVLMFFGITLVVHPEYAYYYGRESYGVWDHVLRPYRGIYAYMFVRLLKDPKKIIKCMKTAGWIMMICFVLQMRQATQRGFWIGFGRSGSVEGSYSVQFGYDVLPFALFFIYDAMKDRKLSDIAGSVITVAMILMAGSRGPILFISMMVIYCILNLIENSRKKAIILLAIVCAAILLYVSYNYILMLLQALITRMGFSSRFINTMLNGTVSDDNHRMEIWTAAWQMIANNPLGYGAMGSRHVIISYIYTGYPHSIVLEFLIDYGVVIGGVLLLVLFGYAFRLLFRHKNEYWRDAFAPFFFSACCLFISMTYWSIPAFWASLGIGVGSYLDMKRQRKSRRLALGSR